MLSFFYYFASLISFNISFLYQFLFISLLVYSFTFFFIKFSFRFCRYFALSSFAYLVIFILLMFFHSSFSFIFLIFYHSSCHISFSFFTILPCYFSLLSIPSLSIFLRKKNEILERIKFDIIFRQWKNVCYVRFSWIFLDTCWICSCAVGDIYPTLYPYRCGLTNLHVPKLVSVFC